LGLGKEVLTVQSLVVVDDGLGVVLGVLKGLDGDSAIKGSGGEEVRVVRVPAGLESPVGDNREFAICLAGLGVPANVAVILTRREHKIRILVAPRKRKHSRLMALEGL
jgi:hypothetical protein